MRERSWPTMQPLRRIYAAAMLATALLPAIPASAQSARDLVGQGIAASNEGKRALALQQFEKAVAADPSFAPALNNLGVMLAASGKLRNAIELYDRALEAEQDNGAIWNNRANANCRLKNVNESYDDRMLAMNYRRFTIRSAKTALRNHGQYDGMIDDVWDGRASEAMFNWTRAGCPRPPKDRLISP